ncbi:hypothetical protein PCK1_000512 [Pneumocystis canis]|nr:hypothetical protein PCK1_000512 [Pneumocystis canis]
MNNKKTKDKIITDFFQPKSSRFSRIFLDKSLTLDNEKEISGSENEELSTEFDFKKVNIQKLETKTIDPIISNYHFSLETLLKDQENRKKRCELFDRAEKLFNVKTIEPKDITPFVSSDIGIIVEKKKGHEFLTVFNKTDIFKKQMYWSFFSNNIEKIKIDDVFFEESESQWDILMFEKDKFLFLLISGYFSDMIDLGKNFSEKFVQWLLDKFSVEENEMLLYGYFSILLKIYSTTSCQMHILSEFQIKRIFSLLGATSEVIDIKSSIEPMEVKEDNDLNNNYYFKMINLKLILNLLRTTLLHNRIKKYQCILLIFSIILKLYMDYKCSFYLESLLHACYLQLFNSISDIEFQSMAFDMFDIAYNITENSSMRLCILQSFPVEHIYGEILRSGLAFSMLLNTRNPPDNFPNNFVFPFPRIFNHIQTSRPFFPIDSNTDYFELYISIYMLDYILSQPLYQDSQIIEKICELLKNIYEKILDSRNAFIIRTETKAKIQRLLLRLIHTPGIFLKKRQSTLEYHFNKI